MKLKRVLLIFDYDDAQAAGLRLMLGTRRYEVIKCFTEAERIAKMNCWPVELLIVHDPIDCDYAGPLPVIHLPRDYRSAQVVEDVRVALIRKRGPKKPVVSCRGPVVRKVAG